MKHSPHFGRDALAAAVTIALAACNGDSTGPGPDPTATPDILLITSVADASGSTGSSFVQTITADQGTATTNDAFEQTFYPYASVFGDQVVITQHTFGDQAVRYVRGADGRLTEGGRMNLPAGGFGASVSFVSDTRAYVALVFAGRLLEFNPQTMTVVREIDLTTHGIARNPANPGDLNPEPAVLAIRDGKLYVGLQQLVSGFESADGTDVAVFDLETNAFERVIHDERGAGAGRYGYNQTMFVDEAGDLYVYSIASFGFVPGQKAGILRIRSGESAFDRGYFVNLTDATVDVPGGRIGFLNNVAYGGNGGLYAIAQVPSLESNPPNYTLDRAFQPVRLDLRTGAVEVLPLPPGNGIAAGLTIKDGRVLFGLSTATGVGVYSYDPVTQQASAAPVVSTVGDPTVVLAF